MNQFAVIMGQHNDQLTGPFDTEDEAIAWAKASRRNFWRVRPLQPPAGVIVERLVQELRVH